MASTSALNTSNLVSNDSPTLRPDQLVTYYDRWTVTDKIKHHGQMVTEETFNDPPNYTKPLVLEMRREMRRDSQVVHDADTGKKEVEAIQSVKMRIHSPFLLKVVPDAIGYYPSYAVRGHKDPSRGPRPYIEISKPYRMLSGARDGLSRVRKRYEERIKLLKASEVSNGSDPPNVTTGSDFDAPVSPEKNFESLDDCQQTVHHIQLLEHELDKISPLVDAEKELHKLNPPLASFNMLWILFRPGTLVVTRIAGEWAAAKVYLPVWTEESNGVSFLKLETWYLDFDGKNICRRRLTVKVQRYDDLQRIDQLPVYPATPFASSDLLAKLANRGRRYWELLGDRFSEKTYDGTIFDIGQLTKKKKEHAISLLNIGNADRSTVSETILKKEFYVGHAIIDPVLYSKEFGGEDGDIWLEDIDIRNGSPHEELMREFVRINPAEPLKKSLTDEHFQLMPQWIIGFAMGIRKWMCFDVALLSDYRADPEMMQSLIVEDKNALELIKAVTTTRHPEKASAANLSVPLWHSFRGERVAGKGEGRVILLHGPPGTGKTFTAECVAEDNGRPLLRLTCGELGLDPTRLEQKLWQWFRMGEEWGAALLIDEADVYVSQRSGNNLQKDTIVAVFLRALEYYRGLLFITTNVVLMLDEAVISRVTIVLEFKAFSRNQRQEMVQRTIEKIANDIKYDFTDGATEKIKDVIVENGQNVWNGREINNFFQLAVAVAENSDRNRETPGSTKGRSITIIKTDVEAGLLTVKEFYEHREERLGRSREDDQMDSVRR